MNTESKLILETARLRLREFTLADAQLIYDLNDDPEVIRYVGDPACADLNAARAVLQNIILPQYRKYKLGRWAAELKDTGECIGWCGIKKLEDSGEYDLGYRFFKRHWGKGYGTELAKATLAFGHTERKLKRIKAMARVENTASLNVLEKIGMKFAGHGFEHDGKIAIYCSDSAR
jgi:ribosomal-protein-alanine N-acetyltransferase